MMDRDSKDHCQEREEKNRSTATSGTTVGAKTAASASGTAATGGGSASRTGARAIQ